MKKLLVCMLVGILSGVESHPVASIVLGGGKILENSQTDIANGPELSPMQSKIAAFFPSLETSHQEAQSSTQASLSKPTKEGKKRKHELNSQIKPFNDQILAFFSR
eukprot:CAMPEP_0194265346 /NCGR_PEP_ID=MMETSP0169-20130528/620_1 /TAXON_ID=218684 /ORGANISM="Corethron pennatum, Strain L29A3" /LENGTH=105 /DNA_ID=CAMNT_0039005789 /DNA_START=117 /DNA_END=434 /DNA_ORIENTATION=+